MAWCYRGLLPFPIQQQAPDPEPIRDRTGCFAHFPGNCPGKSWMAIPHGWKSHRDEERSGSPIGKEVSSARNESIHFNNTLMRGSHLQLENGMHSLEISVRRFD